MMKATVAILLAFALLLAGCVKTNPDDKPPTYFVPPTAIAV
jgi:PBP1b-binding outer membrane lipoprotein LpoB